MYRTDCSNIFKKEKYILLVFIKQNVECVLAILKIITDLTCTVHVYMNCILREAVFVISCGAVLSVVNTVGHFVLYYSGSIVTQMGNGMHG